MRKSVTKSHVICAGKNTQIAQEKTTGKVHDPHQPCVQLHISGVITAPSLSLSCLAFATCLLFLLVHDVLTFSQRWDHFVCAVDPRAAQRSGALGLPHSRKCACNCSCVSSSAASPARIKSTSEQRESELRGPIERNSRVRWPCAVQTRVFKGQLCCFVICFCHFTGSLRHFSVSACTRHLSFQILRSSHPAGRNQVLDMPRRVLDSGL